MSRHVSVLTTVYFSPLADKQRARCFDFFRMRNPNTAQVEHTKLYEGIKSFLANNPFADPYTESYPEISNGYIAKRILGGEEPLLVTIIFTDHFSDGRRVEGISISTIDEKRIFY